MKFRSYVASLAASVVASLMVATPAATAGVVDLKQSPLNQTVSVGSIVNVKIVVSAPSLTGQPWDALDAIVTWDPTRMALIGTTQVGAGAPFFLTGFLPDPDGINTNLTDGMVIFTALGVPGGQIIAPPAPGQLVVTTLQFLALATTPSTPVDFLPTSGTFGQTRVLLGGFNITGDASSIATVKIIGVCPPSGHNCFTTGTPGCADASCCDAVCAIDPFCCSTAWDATCVSEASGLCNGCGDPAAGACCVAHAAPFCSDATCCELVCNVDPFCCSNAWDALCAEETIAFPSCGCDPCSVSNDTCFAVHATPGCDDATCCSQVCAADPSCCETGWDIACKDAANTLCAGCGSPLVGSCFCAHANPGCDDATCCRVVCEADPFCCEAEWDAICATEGNTLCDCHFDIDNNGVVDAADLAQLLGAWGTDQCPFDADGNGNVDGADLAQFLGSWGLCP